MYYITHGHKRVHALNFQSVAIPNGLIANGPVEGRRHDAGMLKESGFLNILQRARSPRGGPLCLYGDPAYPLRPQLIGPCRDADVLVVAPEMRAFNSAMSEVRVSVEWPFGDIAEYFKLIDYKKNVKLGMSAVAK